MFKEVQVKHLKRWEVISLLKAEIFYRAIPWTALILRHNQFINDLNLNWSNRMSVILVYTLLITLTVGWWWTPALMLTLICGYLLLLVNAQVYQFFHNKRGLKFAIRAIPWHWLYYFYSGFSFAIGWTRHHWNDYQSALPLRSS